MDACLRQHGEALEPSVTAVPTRSCCLPSVRGPRYGRARPIHAHVATCLACRRLAEDFDGLGLAEPDAEVEARVLARVTGSPHRGRAGLLSLAAGLLWRPASVSPGGIRAAAHHVAPPVAAQAPAVPAPTAAPPPAAVVALWTITPAPVRLPLSSLGVPRGGGTGATPSGDVLVAALAPYQLGDYTGAVARLSAVVRDFPDRGGPLLPRGVGPDGGRCDAGRGVARPRDLRLPGARRAEAEWYRATAEQRAGRTDEARARVRVLCARLATIRRTPARPRPP